MLSALEIFFSYAHKDEALRDELEKQLSLLKRQGVITNWHDRMIMAGQEWSGEINAHLNTANILLLLVSPDFLASNYCYSVEVHRAMERHERGEACVIPVILRPVYWQGAPFGKLQALPTDGKPVTDRSWHSLDEAFFDVAEGIRRAAEQLLTPSPNPLPLLAASISLPTVGKSVPVVKSEAFSFVRTLSGLIVSSPGLAFSPDGQILAGANYHGEIHIWNLHLQTQKPLRTFSTQEAANPVYSIAISPDGQTLAGGSHDHIIRIWSLHTGQLLRTFEGHGDAVVSIAMTPDGRTLVSGSSDKTIRIWNFGTGQLLRTLEGDTDYVCSIAISPDGQTLVSGGGDTTIRVWNLHTGQLLRMLKGHTALVSSIAITPNGRSLASGSWDQTIRVWNLHTGQLLHVLEGHKERVITLASAPDGQTLASGSGDTTIKLWNLDTGKRLRTLRGFSKAVFSVVFSPSGQLLVGGSVGDKIKIWGTE